MDAKPVAIPSFLRSVVGRGFLIFAICCGLMSVAVGVGTYDLNLHWFAVNKGEEKITAAQLVDAFVTVYSETRSQFMVQDAPVPSRFRAQGIDHFNRMRDSVNALRLRWVGPPEREIITAANDAQVAATINGFANQAKPEPVTQFVTVNKALLFRTVYPVIASQQSCADCHNKIQAAWIAAGRPPWRLNDVMGAAVIDVPVDSFLRQNRIDSALIGLVVFLLSTGIGLVTFYLQYKEFVRRARTEASLIEAKDAAEAASRAKSVFLATMSHELRTPLNAIIGFSEILKNRAMPVDGDRTRAYAQDIHESGVHLLEVINDVLDLSKAEAGKLNLKEEVLKLQSTVDTVTRVMQQRAEAGGVKLATRFAENLPYLNADPTILRQILLNLVSNAIKFTPPGGEVEIAIRRESDGGIVVEVRDTGIGMAEADIPKALEPFQQIDNSLNRQYEGTGLGLPLVKSMIEAHAGSLDIASSPGGGTTVTLKFPARRSVPADQDSRDAPARTAAA